MLRFRRGANRSQPIRGMPRSPAAQSAPLVARPGEDSGHSAESDGCYKRQPATMRRYQLRLHRPDGQPLCFSLHRLHHWQRAGDDCGHPGRHHKRRHLHGLQRCDGYHRRHPHYHRSSQRERHRYRRLYTRATSCTLAPSQAAASPPARPARRHLTIFDAPPPPGRPSLWEPPPDGTSPPA
jgi:hypothetical protein